MDGFLKFQGCIYAYFFAMQALQCKRPMNRCSQHFGAPTQILWGLVALPQRGCQLRSSASAEQFA
jgi:hypothetical protein